MKTTLNLPPDVARTLRLESARRGGRKAASLSKLVSDAVRQAYGSAPANPPKVDFTEGRVTVGKPADVPSIDADDIRKALYD